MRQPALSTHRDRRQSSSADRSPGRCRPTALSTATPDRYCGFARGPVRSASRPPPPAACPYPRATPVPSAARHPDGGPGLRPHGGPSPSRSSTHLFPCATSHGGHLPRSTPISPKPAVAAGRPPDRPRRRLKFSIDCVPDPIAHFPSPAVHVPAALAPAPSPFAAAVHVRPLLPGVPLHGPAARWL